MLFIISINISEYLYIPTDVIILSFLLRNISKNNTDGIVHKTIKDIVGSKKNETHKLAPAITMTEK